MRFDCGLCYSLPDCETRQEIEWHLIRSQRALQVLRRRIAVLWLLVAVSLQFGYFIYRMSLPNWPFAICYLAWEVLQVFVVLSATAVADDDFFCRFILVLDLCMSGLIFGVGMIRSVLEWTDVILVRYWLGWAHFLILLMGIVWVMSPTSSGRVYKGLRVAFGVKAALSIIHSLTWMLPRVSRMQVHKYGCLIACLLPPLIVLSILSSPRLQQGMRRRMMAWLKGRAAVHCAASIACLIGPCRPQDAISQAKQRFKCISGYQLDKKIFADNDPNPAHSALSQPSALGACDAFLSHSWHDHGPSKWRTFQTWREDFVDKHGREPVVWLDKCCIDQNSIDMDLRCLPIFLSACSRLVILCGPTYLSRLWCILEIFTYVHMGGCVDDIEILPVLREGLEHEDSAAIADTFENFDAKNCSCFCEEDRKRVLAIFEAAFGSIAAFNSVVSTITSHVGHRCSSASEP